ncbi:Cyclohexa-1,5-dienecarbonyl-CoA hydratase [Paramagnetospirillum caucaseum]|uniref:Cyclohexa-1,5-dienecarbonyl-CoA hydratase n=1 Tax=Paramagnetospirillum caucaseum TaxID=1244869 RepID=M2ZRJ4_9PROT|nr:cyclohexa-1,5-dienecarbonyl-CoA hydratase [Paramagnetospirillum caucaseum]EME69957.1 Cyclohexa-1,5-dienecarbonyl-CoA hydratase [Paramagnetospirillum caucaseum]
MTDTPLQTWLDRDGRLLRLRLNRPKANIVDAAMIKALDAALAAQKGNKNLSAVLLDHAGPHFSFGASIEEHFPDQMADMLAVLHGLLKRMLFYPCPILVAVRGQCLGGGLEVALAGSMILCSPDAKLGQPEIKLGVFAPAASCLLPERIGPAAAEDLLYTGRSVGADEALRMGVVDRVSEDPEAAALAWFDEHYAPLSACALRFAVKAARGALAHRVSLRLDEVERLCGVDLIKTKDMMEGLVAFQEKRPPEWSNC